MTFIIRAMSSDDNPRTVFVECEFCEAKVSANIHYQMSKYYHEIGEPFQYSFVTCQICNEPMVMSQDWDFDNDGGDFGIPRRVWPAPFESLSFSIPDTIRNSIREAEICFKAGAYNASTVMSARAIEFLGLDHKIRLRGLMRKLEKLKEKRVIDGKLFDWGETLMKKRNLVTHDDRFSISKPDAADLLDFTKAICNYVYVLEDKYQNFLKRQSKK